MMWEGKGEGSGEGEGGGESKKSLQLSDPFSHESNLAHSLGNEHKYNYLSAQDNFTI